MIIWGGRSFPTDRQNTGGVYVPSTDTWRLTSTVNAPDPRYAHTAVWTGNEMIVWGGIGSTNTGNTGARYNPASNTWTVTSVTASTPAKRGAHTAVWTGSEMIVWGGRSGSTAYDNGGRYVPATDTWQPTSTTGTPSARYSHSAVWSGSKMIVWGGGTSTPTDTGAQYDPATDAWQPTSATGAPNARSAHTAIWTGNKMIVWGGGSYSGGRYDPISDAWQPMSTSGYSGGVIGDTAVWTGREMIVWGGGNSNGGRYDPAADLWQPTSIPRFLVGRSDHSAVWTGSSMIVFGGYSMTTTGAAYILPNQAPIARLTANPASGAAPLPVNFNASTSSDADAGDSIASYTFNFGDGSAAVTQAGASTSHTYTAAGTYTATVTVTDSRALQSVNTASVPIQVTASSSLDRFTFIERTGVATSVFVTSERKTMSGFTGTLPISIDNGGQYRIDSGAWTSAAGNIAVNATLTVRHVSASTATTPKLSKVTVGVYSTDFKTTTSSVDQTPDAFDFGIKTGQIGNAPVESDPTTLSSYNTGIPIQPGPGIEYSLGGSNTWSNVSGTLVEGQSIKVRHVTSPNHLGYTKTYLKVGGVTGYFTTRTQ